MRRPLPAICCGAVLASALAPAFAVERLDGWFIAREACEAFQSKNKETNPGDVVTEPFRAYAMIAINAPGGDFFQVKVPGAPVTEDRWVHVSCGLHVVEAGTPTAPLPGGPVEPVPGPESVSNLLALSWQPAFCETKPNKTECLQLNAGELPVTERQLSLHGLWPQPRGKEYCGVPAGLVALDKASQWSDLPEVAVDAETRELLEVSMPGTASFLERHEWIKHGTCFLDAGGPDAYFDDTLRVVDAINASPVAALLADHVGGELETSDLRAAFDAAFGAGAGERVQVHCTGDRGRTLIQEVSVSLAGVIGPDTPPAELILAAEPVTPGCPKGVVDPAGLQ
jgi:ribonuclease T2